MDVIITILWTIGVAALTICIILALYFIIRKCRRRGKPLPTRTSSLLQGSRLNSDYSSSSNIKSGGDLEKGRSEDLGTSKDDDDDELIGGHQNSKGGGSTTATKTPSIKSTSTTSTSIVSTTPTHPQHFTRKHQQHQGRQAGGMQAAADLSAHAVGHGVGNNGAASYHRTISSGGDSSSSRKSSLASSSTTNATTTTNGGNQKHSAASRQSSTASGGSSFFTGTATAGASASASTRASMRGSLSLRGDSMDLHRRNSNNTLADFDFWDPSASETDTAASFLQRRTSQATIENSKMGTIQPDLYKKKGSVIRKQVQGNKCGKLQFKCRYDFGKSDFIVTCLQVTDVSPSMSEFAFRIQLKPGVDDKQRQTSTRKKVDQFQYTEQNFKFPLTYDELMEQRLFITMYDTGRLGRVPLMCGEVHLDLQDVDPSDDIEVWADIESKTQSDGYGQLLISLTYLTSVERLTVTIHQAKGLKKMDIAGSSDPYVKVIMMENGRLLKKRSTSVKKNSLNPTWNEALSFNVPPDSLPAASVQLIVKDNDILGHNETIGRVVIGLDQSLELRSRQMWEDLIRDKSTSATWHYLKHFIDDKALEKKASG